MLDRQCTPSPRRRASRAAFFERSPHRAAFSLSLRPGTAGVASRVRLPSARRPCRFGRRGTPTCDSVVLAQPGRFPSRCRSEATLPRTSTAKVPRPSPARVCGYSRSQHPDMNVRPAGLTGAIRNQLKEARNALEVLGTSGKAQACPTGWRGGQAAWHPSCSRCWCDGRSVPLAALAACFSSHSLVCGIKTKASRSPGAVPASALRLPGQIPRSDSSDCLAWLRVGASALATS